MKKFLTTMLVLGITTITPALAFSDVSEDFWAYEKIHEMYRSGVISGFEDGTFKPGNMITREQAAAIMTNFFDLSQKGEIKKYEDVQPGYWSEPYNQLVGQYMPVDEVDGKYYFRPSDNATRIEVAETIVKIIGYDDEQVNDEIINNFADNDEFSEKDKKYNSAVANNGIMVGDDQLRFRPNDTITRAEFCALIYNIYLMRDDLKAQNTDKVVVTVNGEEVKYKDFNLYFNLQKKIYESMFGTSEIWSEEIEGVTLHEIVKDSTKNGIVSDRVKLQKANEMGIVLSEDVKMEISNYVNSSQGIEICEFYGISKEDFEKINVEKFLITKH